MTIRISWATGESHSCGMIVSYIRLVTEVSTEEIDEKISKLDLTIMVHGGDDESDKGNCNHWCGWDSYACRIVEEAYDMNDTIPEDDM